ncbi:hypothetical protein WJX81_002416 [Elliptochloris bilobata]|uniref:Uncharacterized protein n=1 Tax=Elliptochloris bilobata TaxID=381761 RepID=A0AAW1SI06_9CHLO
MERYLVPVGPGNSSAGLGAKSRALKRGAQRKLKDCKKVVTLEPGTTRVVFSLETVLQAKQVLDSADSSADQVLEKLRFLSCLQVSEATLRESGVRVLHATRALACAGRREAQVSRLPAWRPV